MKVGIKVFQALSVRDNALVIDDKHSPDLANVRVDNPIGALSNIRGTEKYSEWGYGNAITAIHQLNGYIFSLSNGTLKRGQLTMGFSSANDSIGGTKYSIASFNGSIYMSIGGSGIGGVYKLTGTTFNQVYDAYQDTHCYNLKVFNGYLYVTAYQRLVKSSNGTDWTEFAYDVNKRHQIPGIMVIFDNKLFIPGAISNNYKTWTYDGTTLVEYANGFSDAVVMKTFENDLYGLANLGDYYLHLIKWNGSSWDDVATVGDGKYIQCNMYEYNNKLYLSAAHIPDENWAGGGPGTNSPDQVHFFESDGSSITLSYTPIGAYVAYASRAMYEYNNLLYASSSDYDTGICHTYTFNGNSETA